MAQVRKEYLRWIVTYLWYAPPEERKAQLSLNYADPQKYKTGLRSTLRELSEEEFMRIRDAARNWLFSKPVSESDRLLKHYDDGFFDTPSPHLHGKWQEDVERNRRFASA